MWGDLRGGKKSVSELRGTPDTLTVTLQNPNIAYKRQQTFEARHAPPTSSTLTLRPKT